MSQAVASEATIVLQATPCAICKTYGEAAEIYPANFDPSAFNATIFSARRLPDHIHYRMVKCHQCGLVRSDPIADLGLIKRLYQESLFTYGAEVDSLKQTYGKYLTSLETYGVNKRTLLEIGCGNGFFLEEAKRQGYQEVHGVEPSESAIEQAPDELRPNIVCDIMRPNLFEHGQFDVICLFQVFDHLPDPAEVLDACWENLRSNGLILCFNHNVAALSARLLREQSPIIDIEHTYLYSPTTMRRIFQDHQFDVLSVQSAQNRYSIHYLTRLLPLPTAIKQRLLNMIGNTTLGNIRLSVPLGNLCLIARKR